MIHTQALKLLDQIFECSRESKDKFVDMRVMFLAFATIVINEHCIGSESELLKVHKPNVAQEWYQTISSLTHMAPLARQCSWAVPHALRLPSALARLLNPSLARIITLHKVH